MPTDIERAATTSGLQSTYLHTQPSILHTNLTDLQRPRPDSLLVVRYNAIRCQAEAFARCV